MKNHTKSRPAHFLARLQVFAKQKRQLKLPKFGFEYVCALLLDVQRKSLSAIGQAIGIPVSQISRMLGSSDFIASNHLWALSRQAVLAALSKAPTSDGPWKVFVIADSTVLERSASGAQNIQKLNTGHSWKYGHRLTNVVLLINGQLIPLPPIPHKSKAFCKANKEPYLTEGERLREYLASEPFKSVISGIKDSDIAVLADAGYDDRKLQRFILDQGWDFIIPTKTTSKFRVRNPETGKLSISHTSASAMHRYQHSCPKGEVRVKMQKNQKWTVRKFHVQRLSGLLNRLSSTVTMVRTQVGGGKVKHLVCSDERASDREIVLAYAKRFQIECFHKETKQYLGLEDVATHGFHSTYNHICLVYMAYVLLQNAIPEGATRHRQKVLLEAVSQDMHLQPVRIILSQFGGNEKLKKKLQKGPKYKQNTGWRHYEAA
jgi:hypothetical protein